MSINFRRKVTRGFLGMMLASISIAFNDAFAPPTTTEQELSALFFGAHDDDAT